MVAARMNVIPLILFTVLTNAVAQIMLKRGMLALGPLDFSAASPVMTILKVVFQPFVFAGLCIFVISIASHLYVLSRVELSFAYLLHRHQGSAAGAWDHSAASTSRSWSTCCSCKM